MSLPQDWKITSLDDVCASGGLVRGPFGGSLKKSDFVPSGYQVYEQRHAIYGAQNPARYFIDGKKFKEMSRFAVKRGDFIVSCSGTIGRISPITDGARQGIINQALLKIRINPEKIDPEFFMHQFKWDEFQAQILDSTQGGAMQNLVGMSIFRSTPIVLPPRREQRAIARALREIEETTSAVEQLISKKRDIKQGVMQQLLTGRTRLPGFNGVWASRRIGDFTDVKAGGTPSTKNPAFWGGEIPWMSSGEIHQKQIYETSGRITVEGLRGSAASWLPVGTVLMALAGQGKTRGTVAVSRVRLTTNQSLAGILPSAIHDSDFLYYNLDGRYEELRGASTGDGGRGGLNLQIIKNLEVNMPPLDEQKAISQVLISIDEEISLLEQKLGKYKDIKQGMMQQLLTGRVQLPLDKEVEA